MGGEYCGAVGDGVREVLDDELELGIGFREGDAGAAGGSADLCVWSMGIFCVESGMDSGRGDPYVDDNRLAKARPVKSRQQMLQACSVAGLNTLHVRCKAIGEFRGLSKKLK